MVKEQEDMRRQINEAKTKMLSIVERFFADFEKEVNKSIVCFNESVKENTLRIETNIDNIIK